MTHLNNFSYTSRLFIMAVAAFIVAGMSVVFRYNWFKSGYNKIKEGRLPNIKFFAYLLLWVMILTWMLYDFLATIFFYIVPSASAMSLIDDIILNISFSAHSSLAFLLNSVQSAMMTKVTSMNSQPFMNAIEFKLYIVYSAISLILYPAGQWALYWYRLLFTIVPQFFYTLEMTLSSVLIFIMVIRWVRYIRINKPSDQALLLIRTMIVTLLLLVVNNLITGWTLGIINICYVAEPGMNRDLRHSIQPVGKDILTAMFSMSYLSLVVLVMVILHIGKVAKWIGAKKYSSVPTSEADANTAQPTDNKLEVFTITPAPAEMQSVPSTPEMDQRV